MRKKQLEMKNAVSKMKNTLDRIKSRLDEAEDWTNNLEDKTGQNIPSEQQKEDFKRMIVYGNVGTIWNVTSTS